jgi:Protein of unknown function (DUF664)
MNTTNETAIVSIPVAGAEMETLIGALERNRRTFAWKCTGLGPEDMRRTLGPGSVTLGGLLKHLALVEDDAFIRQLTGAPTLSPPFDAVDFDADPEWEWRTAADDSPEELLALWEGMVARSRENIAAAYAEGGPDVHTRIAWADGQTPTLRRMMVDMIEEYARHTGHADLIRESIDGLVGEGMPPA